ncbi:Predicted DNA-binding transcriptional regulator YafY, contains an HTH and WYL domains [Fodinibius roseus]|uniref:Predicted DNA-binding transcriptional regulator YafY, contains an HTH and WYL domains n=1 Tax=Fodinibius roseus TaxID=1194090 RepID=A0A1M5FRJ6_9BACT|nr:YafY family protein [Fodinibius roseus]SHF94197.1 Predicted DNA-binding transcriptional regulator YafY, contains an HTH and WYL domains [Fodinibius roseus]
MNRIDRLTAMIIYLQGRPRVTVGEMAERYDISKRTVYRDLRALQEAGVPIGSEQGVGYFIVRGYHLPPVMFDKEEAAALLAGERLMQKWSETKLSESYLSALDKIRAVLRSREKEYLDILDRHIKAFPYPDEKHIETDRRVFVFLQDAIVNRVVVAMEYYSPYKDQHTQRDVEPLGLLLRGSHWYLAGWCRLRTDYRMFRVDRIRGYKKTTERLSDPPEHTLKAFSEQSLRDEQDLHEVVVRFAEKIIRYMGDQKYYHGWIAEEEVDGAIEMTFLTASMEYFARWLLTWGDGVTIKTPERLKTRMGELSEELYHHYKE